MSKPMETKERFTAYVTKYALTAGIIEVEADQVGDDMIQQVGAAYSTYYHGNDWWRTRAEAVAYAEKTRATKIKSLEKSLATMRALDFGPKP